MSPIKFFYVPGSPPCRGVLLTAAALNIDMDMKILNLMKGEHMTPEFIKVHTLNVSFTKKKLKSLYYYRLILCILYRRLMIMASFYLKGNFNLNKLKTQKLSLLLL